MLLTLDGERNQLCHMLLHSLYFEPLLFKNSLKQMEEIKQKISSSENRWQSFQAL